MTDSAPRTKSPYERDLPAAFRAVRKLLSNPDDTTQVFVIMRSLNGRMQVRNFERLMKTKGGPRLVYRRLELAERFSDPAFIASFAPGTVGATYRDFLNATGYTAQLKKPQHAPGPSSDGEPAADGLESGGHEHMSHGGTASQLRPRLITAAVLTVPGSRDSRRTLAGHASSRA